MANFVEELWNAVFTPGPTPPLLLATNVTFACLQMLLFMLLVATYSLHFIVLSLLSGGLWLSINWFAKEVMTEQRKRTAQEEKSASQQDESGNSAADGDLAEDEMDSNASTDTEVNDPPQAKETSRSVPQSSLHGHPTLSKHGSGQISTSSALRPEADPSQSTLKQRQGMTESTGDLSTDSEWEKVEDEK